MSKEKSQQSVQSIIGATATRRSNFATPSESSQRLVVIPTLLVLRLDAMRFDESHARVVLEVGAGESAPRRGFNHSARPRGLSYNEPHTLKRTVHHQRREQT